MCQGLNLLHWEWSSQPLQGMMTHPLTQGTTGSLDPGTYADIAQTFVARYLSMSPGIPSNVVRAMCPGRNSFGKSFHEEVAQIPRIGFCLRGILFCALYLHFLSLQVTFVQLLLGMTACWSRTQSHKRLCSYHDDFLASSFGL